MIKVLEKNISDKIAAGEVIERPISIVKELVENALDAGATSILIEIRHGGKSYIRITDNGCGIPADEVETAFLRHATSKITSAVDLNSIGTLGFRGEALASIAAVTRTEIVTKTGISKTGHKVVIHGSEILTSETTGCPDGTTIIVTDLFYNTPARLKFLKSDSAESGLIIDFISQVALAYKNIKFRLINNGKILFSTTGDGNRLNTILRVYNDVDAMNLVPVEYSNGDYSIEGYISTPALSRATRGSQIFFVNGRVVNSKVIERGVSEGYRERLFEGRHPVAYLFLNTDPAVLDVNIHPNKREVRFDNESFVSEFISEAIKKSLATKDAVVDAGNLFKRKEISISSEKVYERVFDAFKDYNKVQPDKQEKTEQQSVDIKSLLSTKINPAAKIVDVESEQNKSEQNKSRKNEFCTAVNAEESNWADVKYSGSKKDTENIKNTEISAATVNLKTKGYADSVSNSQNSEPLNNAVTDEDNLENKAQNQIEIYESGLKPFDFDDLSIIGVIFNTYIAAQDKNNFYLIDQHAAHERIFYEKLVGEYNDSKKSKQQILVPFMINVSASTDAKSDYWKAELEKMGFSIEEFGSNSYRVFEIPMFMEISEAEDFANNFIEQSVSQRHVRANNTVVIDKLITMSCKAAIKAHDVLKDIEISALIKDLSGCINPFSCPHGRPTFIKLSHYEIEKMFKRV